MPMWVSSAFFGFFPPPKNTPVGELATINCPCCEGIWVWYPVMEWSGISQDWLQIHCDLTRRKHFLKANEQVQMQPLYCWMLTFLYLIPIRYLGNIYFSVKKKVTEDQRCSSLILEHSKVEMQLRKLIMYCINTGTNLCSTLYRNHENGCGYSSLDNLWTTIAMHSLAFKSP